MRIIQSVAAALLIAAFATTTLAQTVGIGTSARAYTNQAGAAISKVVSQNTSINMRAQTYGGSSVYVPLLNAGQLEFALANELETVLAVAGKAIYKNRPQANLRVLTVLTPFWSAVFARADSNIRTIADLKGKRVPSGWVSQKIIGVLMNGTLASAGLTYDDVVKVPVPSVVSGASLFAQGKTDVFFFALGSGKVQEAAAKVGGVRVLDTPNSPAAVARMRKYVPPAYPALVKPSKLFVGVEKPVHVMAYDYLALTSAKVSDKIVYTVAKAMHDNPGELAKSFPALKNFSPQGMVKNFKGIKYHPGAVKYYTEIGAWPPK